jgi:hypothetical protein
VEGGGGYWYEIEARRVAVKPEQPHGLKYSLTLHDPSGARVFGVDNAHGTAQGSGPGRRRPVEWDHQHRGEAVRIYEYGTAEALLDDFFAGIDRVLAQRGVKP